MRRSTHMVIQSVLVIAQFLPHIWPFLPPSGIEAWHGMISGVQGVLASAAHSWNVDGSGSTNSTVKG